ncbi:class I SAM-dependent methyltransferase [Solirhodobacter olei]|uniref:class I SAM-dependent methyltransferase n=1 Tax=Solirhodobacter olei TaxID=2493082 RepID=UPI000FDBAED0|nr:class I SAM-dependent methyltransferase [Solirhodobacter olei]
MIDRSDHWERIYREKPAASLSWHEAIPRVSLDLIEATSIPKDAWIVDIGGGASRLADGLVAAGYSNLTVLDLSATALAQSRSRIGREAPVEWVVADVLQWEPTHRYALWHDRAVFHFLTAPEDRASYRDVMLNAIRPGGYAIVGTFAPDGPERCSGLPVVRYDAKALMDVFGMDFALRRSIRHEHVTPAGTVQNFHFGTLQRL